jgi:ribosomal protein S18 acetylase RimI-like enzyme
MEESYNNMTQENKEKYPEITVDSPKPEDARAVSEVFYKTWLVTYPNEEHGVSVEDIEERYKDAFTEEGIAKRAEKIEHPKEGEVMLVARDRENIVGVCNISQDKEVNHLNAIYVLPEYQGKGVGKLLWQEAQKYFDSVKDTVVEVAVYNDNAIKFYKRLGFEETGKTFVREQHRMKSGVVIPETELIIRNNK